MKKILIIAQHIFPMQTPRAHRTTELVKEFARKGHEVTVYAVLGAHDYSDFESEYGVKVKGIDLKWQLKPFSSDGHSKRNIIDRILGRVLGKFEFPNIEFVLKVKELLKKEIHNDLLITIADPHPIHWGAAKAKTKFGNDFPSFWIADCGDPYMHNGASRKLKCFAKYERLFCSLSDFITVPHKGAIDAYYPEYQHKIKVVPQGFEFDLNKRNASKVENNIISFAYAGVFLEDIRNPKKLFDYLITLETDFRFYIYTAYTNLFEKYIPILGDKLVIKEPIPRAQLLENLKEMDFLLNFENLNTPSAIPSKLIDYSIVGRPILSLNQKCIKEEVVEQFLNKDYSNEFVVSDLSQYHISNVVDSFLALSSHKGLEG